MSLCHLALQYVVATKAQKAKWAKSCVVGAWGVVMGIKQSIKWRPMVPKHASRDNVFSFNPWGPWHNVLFLV
ncbi:hypothetical protein [Budvicia aquatica]|uniref:hypothetical protein n=1 Tax=Budvicia aquatica TaxID=82979 RepID=UPI00106D5184|nr:hypothetical protein [Budvicia aquatica]